MATKGFYGGVFHRSKEPNDDVARLVFENLTYIESLVVRDDVVYAGETQLLGPPPSPPPHVYVGDGGPVELVAAAGPQRMVADDRNLYFTSASDLSVFRLAQSARDAGGGVPVAVGPKPANVGALAIDETFLYWVTPQESGYVLRARKDADGGAAEVIASDVRGPLGVAVDQKTICWSEWETGKIWCVAK